jgi:hypothetical protein
MLHIINLHHSSHIQRLQQFCTITLYLPTFLALKFCDNPLAAFPFLSLFSRLKHHKLDQAQRRCRLTPCGPPAPSATRPLRRALRPPSDAGTAVPVAGLDVPVTAHGVVVRPVHAQLSLTVALACVMLAEVEVLAWLAPPVTELRARHHVIHCNTQCYG